MSESQVERLLQQLTLKEPRRELDERIAACVRPATPVAVAGQERIVTFGLLSVVAVACLVIGGLFGHATAIVTRVDAHVAGQGDEAEVNKERTGGDGTAVSEQDMLHGTDIEIPEGLVRDAMRGPGLAMICAVGMHVVEGSAEEQCLQCHHGVVAAKSRFRHEHMQSERFETCMLCHNATTEPHGPDSRPLYR